MENITAAKKALEKKIISKEYVTSIGTRQNGSKNYIEVGVSSKEHIAEIKSLLTEDKWWGYNVKIVIKSAATPI